MRGYNAHDPIRRDLQPQHVPPPLPSSYVPQIEHITTILNIQTEPTANLLKKLKAQIQSSAAPDDDDNALHLSISEYEQCSALYTMCNMLQPMFDILSTALAKNHIGNFKPEDRSALFKLIFCPEKHTKKRKHLSSSSSTGNTAADSNKPVISLLLKPFMTTIFDKFRYIQSKSDISFKVLTKNEIDMNDYASYLHANCTIIADFLTWLYQVLTHEYVSPLNTQNLLKHYSENHLIFGVTKWKKTLQIIYNELRKQQQFLLWPITDTHTLLPRDTQRAQRLQQRKLNLSTKTTVAQSTSAVSVLSSSSPSNNERTEEKLYILQTQPSPIEENEHILEAEPSPFEENEHILEAEPSSLTEDENEHILEAKPSPIDLTGEENDVPRPQVLSEITCAPLLSSVLLPPKVSSPRAMTHNFNPTSLNHIILKFRPKLTMDISSNVKNCTLHPIIYGSQATGLTIGRSDIDICIIYLPRRSLKIVLKQFYPMQ